jgi:hypothetical protein
MMIHAHADEDYERLTDEPRIVDYIKQKVMIDSGASEHMIGDPSFIDAPELYCVSVILPNSAVIACTQRGIMRVTFHLFQPTGCRIQATQFSSREIKSN